MTPPCRNMQHALRGRDFCNRRNYDNDKQEGRAGDARDVPTVEVTVEYLDALRKAVGLQIDPCLIRF